MAGLPDGGIDNARSDLFEGRTWMVCPEHSTPAAREAVADIILLTGAHLVEITPEQHDRAVAVTSHLPQLLASALFTLAHDESARIAMGPAFERATRGAGGLESMWSDIFRNQRRRSGTGRGDAEPRAGAESRSVCGGRRRIRTPRCSVLARARTNRSQM